MSEKRFSCTFIYYSHSFLVLITFVIDYIQVTPKTLADVKGGTLISYEGKVQVYITEY